jgi:hypothetical protein
MATRAQIEEGPQAFARFEDAMQKILSASPDTVREKIARKRAESQKKPNRPGPKAKPKTSL